MYGFSHFREVRNYPNLCAEMPSPIAAWNSGVVLVVMRPIPRVAAPWTDPQ
jgi:hypothetical protein